MDRVSSTTPGDRRPFVRGAIRRASWLLIAVTAFMATLTAPLSAAAQDYDFYLTFWGYIAYDESTVMLLGELEPDDPRMAAEFVSPQYGDDFFDGFGAFDDYYIADSLRNREVDQIDDADEYLVYEGWLELEDGYDYPGYVMFLSVDGMVYIIIGFEDDRADLFDLAEETIDRGQAPRNFDGYDREAIDI
jgi:hypothetical protein